MGSRNPLAILISNVLMFWILFSEHTHNEILIHELL